MSYFITTVSVIIYNIVKGEGGGGAYVNCMGFTRVVKSFLTTPPAAYQDSDSLGLNFLLSNHFNVLFQSSNCLLKRTKKKKLVHVLVPRPILRRRLRLG